jgi:hypothetical protein
MSDVVGVVLGSMDAGPLDFWIGVGERALVQLDDVVVVEAPGPIAFFGVVSEVRKRYEGATFETDAFRARDGTLPVEVSYAAHVQVTRIDPEVFAPPHPGTEVRLLSGEAFQRALHVDRMERRLPIGAARSGEPLFANVDFLDGTRGAHASISGISGVATKTSYATFLLYSLFHSDALGSDAANARALIFNVKGEDLLWLDRPNRRLDEAGRASYARLGLEAGPFESAGFFAPPRRHGDLLMPDVGSRHEGIEPFAWTARDFARDRHLHFAFADGADPKNQLSFLIARVERVLERAAREGDPNDPGFSLDGVRIDSFEALVDHLDSDALDAMAPRAADGTRDALRRRLHGVAHHIGHLIRGDRSRGVDWMKHQVTVVDLHALHSTAQMFVAGVLLKRLLEDKELQGTARPLVFVVLDELNKYAPRSGYSPIGEILLDVAERGRSLGVSLFGAQQTASEVERRVVANASLRIVGRLDAAEAERDEYRFLTSVARRRATMLSPGSMIVTQPEVPVPLLVQFPFPAWATRASEAVADDPDPFARRRV